MPDSITIDWAEAAAEATQILSDYIRIDTTNPPGGEEAGALFLRDLLARDGIRAELHDAGNGRVSLSARLEANRPVTGKPIVLLSHIDVVPVEPEHWEVDAFSGRIVDGVLWGRGTLDMKGMGVMELVTLLLAKRHDIPRSRDILFIAVADEEEGGRFGVHHIREHAPELFDAAYVFNEGAYGLSKFLGQDTTMFGLGPSEKSPCWVKLVTKGTPGHGSVPHSGNAVARLVRALARIDARDTKPRLTAPVEAMFRSLQQKGLVPGEIDLRDQATLDAVAASDAHIGALTSDTVSLTGITAGHKHNVIPSIAEATLDCRILPDKRADAFIAELGEIVDDPKIDIVPVLKHDSGESSMDTLVASVVRQVIEDRYGAKASVMPMLSPGFTDSHAFRAAGVDAYGFMPVLLTPEDLATIHGHNERISLVNLRLGTEILFDVVQRLAMLPAAAPGS